MVISKIFEKYAEALPLWIWLLWIPQLLSSLPRVEGLVLKKILEKLGMVYPQALYFGVRAYYFKSVKFLPAGIPLKAICVIQRIQKKGK
jgi:hypothetical protein